MSLGLKGTYQKVMSANGPAQMLTYGFWSVIIAGMFYGVDRMLFPDWLVLLWGCIGAIIIPVTIWCSKTILKYTLLFDMFLTAIILSKFMMHEPHSAQSLTYFVNTANGMIAAVRPTNVEHSISQWFHGVSLVWMSLHSLYLANLTHRQILEKKRFS
jgi:hypothetical protein